MFTKSASYLKHSSIKVNLYWFSVLNFSQAKAESEKREADIKIQELKEDINVRTHEAQREGRKRDKLDRELKTARLDLESKNIEIKNKQSTLQKLQEECSRLEANLKEQKVRFVVAIVS